MKQLGEFGAVGIVSSPNFTRRPRHDTWPSHADDQPSTTLEPVTALSGKVYGLAAFTLSNGVYANYIYSVIPPQWPPAPGPYSPIGQTYNYLVRPTLLTKLIGAANLDAWLNTH